MRFNNLWRWKALKTILVISVGLASALAYAVCPPQYQEMFVQPQFQNATEVLKAAITAVDEALAALLKLESERLTSAIAVLTKQKALAANQIAESSRIASQQVATGMNILAQTERVKQARFNFGGEFGQGFSPCKVYATRQVISNRDADMGGELRARIISEVVAAPGLYSDPVKGQRALLEAHKDFCTPDQVDSGLCKTVGSMPGANLSAATLFEPAIEGEKLYDAKISFVNNVVGLPNGSVPQSAGKTPRAGAYSLAKARKDAIISPAIASLKEIQLDYSGVAGSETGKDLPLAIYFRNEVNRYSGNGEESEAWARVMSAQNERGALVELLKIKALDLALQEKIYRQYERMEAELAALVALEVRSSRVADQTTKASERAVKQNIINSVK